jgi:hypothetical protein
MPELECGCRANSCGDCEVDCCGAECCARCCECQEIEEPDGSLRYSEKELEACWARAAENRRIRRLGDDEARRLIESLDLS